MAVTYTINGEVEAADVAELFLRAGLKRPSDDLERIGRMLAGANLVVSVWDGERLVGIARALTDFAYCCYLSDLAVDADYQKQGIGQNWWKRFGSKSARKSCCCCCPFPTP